MASLNWMYNLGRENLLSMRDTLKDATDSALDAEKWAREFSRKLVRPVYLVRAAPQSNLTFDLQNDVLEVANEQPDKGNKGLKDEAILMLLNDARIAIRRHATSSWISHSPILCEGVEDQLRELDALYAASSNLHRPASATMATHPSPIATGRQIAPITMGAHNSPLHLEVTTLPGSPTMRSLLFQSEANSPTLSAGNTLDIANMQRATRSTMRGTVVGVVNLQFIFHTHFLCSCHALLRRAESANDLRTKRCVFVKYDNP